MLSAWEVLFGQEVTSDDQGQDQAKADQFAVMGDTGEGARCRFRGPLIQEGGSHVLVRLVVRASVQRQGSEERSGAKSSANLGSLYFDCQVFVEDI